jgi:UDP-glucose 4-epimerase
MRDAAGGPPPILITGSAGLVGRAVRAGLEAAGEHVVGFDIRDATPRDVLDRHALDAEIRRCRGVVHLAAVSRVVWGEADPDSCRRVNVTGTGNVLAAAIAAAHRPWVVFASSREVYGQAERLPAGEDCPLAPLNVYGWTKVIGERATLGAQDAGLRVAVVRLSNAYGSTVDHPDRVFPAFARAVAVDGELRVDGAHHTFDFTHVEDTAAGIIAVTRLLDTGEARLPPIQLVTGRPMTLGELARLAVRIGDGRGRIVETPPRVYDVARFWGDGSRARDLLRWSAEIPVETGMERMVRAFQCESGVGI